MPKSGIDSKSERIDEEKPKMPHIQPTVANKVARERVSDAISEGNRLLGIHKEYSGWDVYNNEAKKVDAELVKDWTTSLNFLLLFAAIFASVLTAFIIESKKGLEPDPVVTMLDVMIFYTNNVSNGMHIPYAPIKFEAETSLVVVNCLFFTSLIASLVAALASVVALQWVADYDAAITRGGSSPEDRAKRRQLRYAGVVWWKMSEIIAALPLLLYFSVIIFFAGLILWMWDTNHAVGAVVAGGTAVAVLFYVTSTLIAVIFISAPFRTPLSRWIYSLLHLPFSVLYWIMGEIPVSTIPLWVERRHFMYTASHKREDQAVEKGETLGREALIWLVNQLSISQDSYQRLLLLAGELRLKAEHLPSFEPTEALWYRIFDLLGWRYLKKASSAIVSLEEQSREMEVLQRCYKLPVIQKLVHPVGIEDLTNENHDAYWSRYCDSAEDGQWTIGHSRPNHLFLLLRDIPCPSEFSPREKEITEKLSEWRNRLSKDPQVWDEEFSNAYPLPSEFFNSCVTTFGNFCSGESWYLQAADKRELFISTARKVVQIALLRGDLLPRATLPLVKAYEALLVGFGGVKRQSPSCLTVPFSYGQSLQKRSSDDHATHTDITLLLLRQINSYPTGERALHVRDIIAMLWLRPSSPTSKNWRYFKGRVGMHIDADTALDWVKDAQSIPHILEILRYLATAQRVTPP